MKNREWYIWIPILGILSMAIHTQWGRHRQIYYAGLIWPVYQVIVTLGTALIAVKLLNP